LGNEGSLKIKRIGGMYLVAN